MADARIDDYSPDSITQGIAELQRGMKDLHDLIDTAELLGNEALKLAQETLQLAKDKMTAANTGTHNNIFTQKAQSNPAKQTDNVSGNRRPK